MKMRGASTRASEAVLFLLAALFLSPLPLISCQPPVEQHAMGDAIAMGPFVFSVDGTSEGLWREDKVINVRLRLDQERSQPFKKPFSEFLFTEMELVDRAENSVELSSFGPVSGTVLSADEWEARFTLSEIASKVQKGEELGDRVSDFSLEIKNPDRREGQAARVSIPLR